MIAVRHVGVGLYVALLLSPVVVAQEGQGSAEPGLPISTDEAAEAFQRIKEASAPLTPEQIAELHEMADAAERASAAIPGGPPRPVSRAVTVNLLPGAEPAIVRLYTGFVTSLVFVDDVGAPLRVITSDVMKGGFVVIEDAEDAKAPREAVSIPQNVVKVHPVLAYATGNILVTLEGVPVPVTLTLVSGQREVDYRVDVRIRGGVGKAGLVDAPGASGSRAMREFLSGGTPPGAKPVTTDNSRVAVWSVEGRYYVRTDLTLLSPAYVNPGRSADGTHWYEIPPASVLVLSAAGRLVTTTMKEL